MEVHPQWPITSLVSPVTNSMSMSTSTLMRDEYKYIDEYIPSSPSTAPVRVRVHYCKYNKSTSLKVTLTVLVLTIAHDNIHTYMYA